MSRTGSFATRVFGDVASQRRLARPCTVSVIVAIVLGIGMVSGGAGASAPGQAVKPVASPGSAQASASLAAWTGPYGGLPPFDRATPQAIDVAWREAIASKRADIRAIADDPAPATFENTIAPIEEAGRSLRLVEAVARNLVATVATPELQQVEQALSPVASALEDEIAHDSRLFARIDAVFASRARAGLTAEQRRLIEVVHDRFLRRGAALGDAAKTRLSAINARIAVLQAQFNQNLVSDQDTQAVFLEDEASLAGLTPAQRSAAAAAATTKGRPGQWAIPNIRPAVWPFLTNSVRRDLREKVWRMWTTRGDHAGDHDNKPVINEILKLRGEKARLLGYPSFAHLATADRMAGTPDAAIAQIRSVWDRVIGPTQTLIADLQAIADSEGASFRLAPWDRLHYTEKLRRSRFGVDSEAVKAYLPAAAILEGIFWTAGRVHGLTFKPVPDAPVCHPDVQVFAVSRGAAVVALLWVDLYARPGKMPGSWSTQYRVAESFRKRVIPIAALYSNVQRPTDGSPALLPWEVANVLFHEMGHVLHMLSYEGRYPSLGSLTVPWDFVEVPALLNERWVFDREMLRRFARHVKTGEPIPSDLVDKIERAVKFDRVFSLNLDYLAPAMVDMRMHLLANGREVDAVQVEDAVVTQMGMPAAWDLIMRVPHSVHSFSDSYAAGVYSYLWADVLAADIAEAFERAPGGFYDPATADRWRRTILNGGNVVPVEQAFRAFRGRGPDPDALPRRFGLLSSK